MNNDLEQFSEERLKEILRARNVYAGDIHDLKALARIVLSIKQAKPVAQVYQPANIGICAALGPAIRMINVGLPAGTLLYTTPQPAHTEQVIPDGWKLVPIEPTEAMKKAYYDSSLAPISKLSVTGYRALIAATPKPESE